MAEGTVKLGQNRLLKALDRVTRDALAPDLKLVELSIKDSVYKAGKPIRNVYFPLSGVISLLASAETGPPIEVATIGNEGMAGLPLFLGTDRSPGSCFCQVPGSAVKMSAAAFLAAIKQNGAFTQILHRYTQALMVQISQSTACNRAHSTRERCARWLLLTHDRVGKDDFLLTQEFLGEMLGVRRASVGTIAASLQRSRLIRYSRGRITILDRRGLESVSCVCYSIVKKEYDRLLRNSAK